MRCRQIADDGRFDIEAAREVAVGQVLTTGEDRPVAAGLRDRGVMARLARGEAVVPSEYFFRTVMRFETSAPALAWLNGAIAVAQAERQGGSVVLHAWQVL